jgi:hypothetical protein
MADYTKIGKEYTAASWEVERGKIRELIRAIGDFDPVYVDKQAAIQEGYKDCPAPPTYLTVPMMWSSSVPGVLTDLSINLANILHGEEEYEYYSEIYPGDVLSGTPRVSSIVEKTSKSGRKMNMITIEILYTKQNGETVAKARTLLVERV